MNKFAVLLAGILFSFFCCAQEDSLRQGGTLKVRKKTDSLHITVSESWQISRVSQRSDLTFVPDKKLAAKTTVYSPEKSVRRTVTAPYPELTDDIFDLALYLYADPGIRRIRLRESETDEVRLYVTVDKRGRMRFKDVQTVEMLGDTLVVYTDETKQEYKIDAAHLRTAKAFETLSHVKWHPAEIRQLKRHPSKRRIKYRNYIAYSSGIITIRYSALPSGD
jgi:hypothetical protein